jgi:soluble P-type ATPase
MRNKFLKSLKVLLVEDEEKLAQLFKNAIGDNFHSFLLAKNELKEYALHVKVLESDNHTLEKEAYISALHVKECAAIGNGNNDIKMLQKAQIGICVIGDEGCSTKSLLASDIVCKSITEALELFIHPKRLVATLRV